MDTQETDHTKLDRRCPRCRAHHYHFACSLWKFTVAGAAVRRIEIDCVECGHKWYGKYRKDEWDEHEVAQS